MLPALGLELLVFGLSVALMRAALARRRGAGLFAGLPAGLVPVFVLAALFFVQFQHGEDPGVRQVRGEWVQQWEQAASISFPKPEQAALREDFRALGLRIYRVIPALQFCVHGLVLALLAMFLRRRRARAGLDVQPEPLGHWTAPFGLIWLVLAPVFWIYGNGIGALRGPAWLGLLAENLLVVGLALYVAQGGIILLAKLSAWNRHPRTRGLAPLALMLMALMLFIRQGLGLLYLLVFFGLFEPWMDLRRLRAGPAEGDQAS